MLGSAKHVVQQVHWSSSTQSALISHSDQFAVSHGTTPVSLLCSIRTAFRFAPVISGTTPVSLFEDM